MTGAAPGMSARIMFERDI